MPGLCQCIKQIRNETCNLCHCVKQIENVISVANYNKMDPWFVSIHTTHKARDLFHYLQKIRQCTQQNGCMISVSVCSEYDTWPFLVRTTERIRDKTDTSVSHIQQNANLISTDLSQCVQQNRSHDLCQCVQNGFVTSVSTHNRMDKWSLSVVTTKILLILISVCSRWGTWSLLVRTTERIQYLCLYMQQIGYVISLSAYYSRDARFLSVRTTDRIRHLCQYVKRDGSRDPCQCLQQNWCVVSISVYRR